MASSGNVEENSSNRQLGPGKCPELVHIGLLYCSISYHLLCMAQSANDKIFLLQIHADVNTTSVNMPAPFTSAYGAFATK